MQWTIIFRSNGKLFRLNRAAYGNISLRSCTEYNFEQGLRFVAELVSGIRGNCLKRLNNVITLLTNIIFYDVLSLSLLLLCRICEYCSKIY